MKTAFHQRGTSLIGCALMLGLAGPLTGQQTSFAQGARDVSAQPSQRPATVRGMVRDSGDTPVPFATIIWGDARQVITTSDSGSFSLVDIPPGRTRFTVRRMGFVPVDFDLTLKPGVIKPVVVHLLPAASHLSPVEVETRNLDVDDDTIRAARFRATGFFDRQARLTGYFIPPAEVNRRRPSFISDLMHSVPGVSAIGRPHTSSLRYVSSSQHCRLQLYLDGHPAPDGDDLVPGSDIKAVEVYTSLLTASDRFSPSPLKGYCGSIVVWTK
jgi:carboxypeptidase family protein